MSTIKLSRYAKYAWGVLFYNLVVILWGAYVRATGSGAGCGGHWPTCNGVVIPQDPKIATIIEFTHRMSSGLSVLVILILLIWAFRAYPKGSPVRLGASLSMFFIITEALVGAGLVLFGWVAQNASLQRAFSISVHLINTFFLLASISLTAWWASGGKNLNLRGQGVALWGIIIGLLGMLILGVSGALTALGDTLFPAGSLAAGMRQDFLPTANFLIRLRVLHPFIAVGVGFYWLLFINLYNFRSSNAAAQGLRRLLTLLILIQLGAGLLNVILLAPDWMQLVHLLLADAVWITMIFFTASAFEQREEQYQTSEKTSRLNLEPKSVK